MSTIDVTLAGFRPASSASVARGLLGHVSVVLGDTLLLEGIALRRARSGRRYLSFPRSVAGGGARRDILRPVDRAARARIEAAVLAALGLANENAVSPPPRREGAEP